MGEAGRGGELPEKIDQILLDVNRVEGVVLKVRVHLVIIVEVVLGRSQELTQVNLPVVGGRGVTLLAVLIVPLIIIVVFRLGILIVLNMLELVRAEERF